MNYTYYNRNPQNMHKSDCVCRAISTAMDMDYYEVENLLYKNSKYQSCDTLTKSCYRNLLEKEFGLQSHYGPVERPDEPANPITVPGRTQSPRDTRIWDKCAYNVVNPSP